MLRDFNEMEMAWVEQAVQADIAGNYKKAFELYMNALEFFKEHMKCEKNPEIKGTAYKKFFEYLNRAKEIRAILDDGETGSACSGDVANALVH
ncbi:hypothetical protein IFM89_024043 [Coptis chinensis]|uniref:MIT domain-containing protein n=1 Tax=Coptis chinensis TaxID=261450 RepID=A0A835HF86_9MAGN|nr:hypothetical protein IFM89_024043 [Coptis chinensis]